MDSFLAMRKLAKSLADSFRERQGCPELVERSRLISDELNAPYWDRLPGDVSDLAPHFENAARVLRKQWNDIASSDAAHEQVIRELEAAWALTIAWSEAISRYRTMDREHFLDELFGLQIAEERGHDILEYEHCQKEYVEARRGPAYMLLSAGALAVVASDRLHGSNGIADAFFGLGGFTGLVVSTGMLRGIKSSRARLSALETKWSGAPTQSLPDRDG